MISILSGSNSYALRAELRKLVDAFKSEHGDSFDMAYERLDGEEASYERMQEALQSLPFLASKKLVVLSTPGANKQFMEQASSLLAELPETTDLIIVEPKLDKRMAYYKLLKKQKGFREFAELDAGGLARWLVSQALSMGAGVRLRPADATYLVERAGVNQQKLAGEIEKLSLYALSHAADSKDAMPTITREDIEALTPATPQSKIFDLLDAAFAGNTRRTLALYEEQRILKVEPQQIIAMISWQLHILAIIKAAGPERTTDQIASEAKVNPYVLRKSVGVARLLSMPRIRQLVGELTTIDHRLKRESLDADDVLQAYLIRLAD